MLIAISSDGVDIPANEDVYEVDIAIGENDTFSDVVFER